MAQSQRAQPWVSQVYFSYHTLLLNHVARRASKAQGIALLTLYSKAFAKPINLDREAFTPSASHARDSNGDHTANGDAAAKTRIELAATLVDKLKMAIRRSSTRASVPGGGEVTHGHLPICWAVFAACLGISLKKAVFLHLFLQARSLFSSSIRLNTLGPYLAHQIMRFQMRTVVERVIHEMEATGCLDIDDAFVAAAGKLEGQEEQMQVDQEEVQAYDIPQSDPAPENTAVSAARGKSFRNTATMTTTTPTSSLTSLRPKVQALRIGKGKLIAVDDDDPNQSWAWDWPEEQDICAPQSRVGDSEKGFWTQHWAPATTYPLGEIIQARHDQLHSRLFNS